jgi:hypothetical protein
MLQILVELKTKSDALQAAWPLHVLQTLVECRAQCQMLQS